MHLNDAIFHLNFFNFSYVGNNALSHISSPLVLSMASSNIASTQSNIYLVDLDYYHKHQSGDDLPAQYSV
jgi:hypothetical protein